MYVVIFRARIRALDEQYRQSAARLRTLALERYGCMAFHALSEGEEEIALSYWPDEAAIRAWNQDPEHQQAQRLGRERWYEWHRVEVAQIERAYGAGQ